MAARSSSAQKSSSTKSIRITYEELVKLAEEFDQDKKKKHSRRKSKEKASEHENDVEKTTDDHARFDDERKRLSSKDKEKRKNKEKESSEEMPGDEKSPRKKGQKKKAKERYSVGVNAEGMVDAKTGNNSTSTTKGDDAKQNQNFEENLEKTDETSPEGKGVKKKHRKHSSKSKDKSKHKITEEEENDVASLETECRHVNKDVDKDSDKSDILTEKSKAKREHRRSRRKNRSSSLEENVHNEELWDLDTNDVHIGAVNVSGDTYKPVKHEEESQISKTGSILRTDNHHNHREMHVHFSASDDIVESIDNTQEEVRGIIRIPQGVDIHENDSAADDDVWEVTDKVDELKLDEQHSQMRDSRALYDADAGPLRQSSNHNEQRGERNTSELKSTGDNFNVDEVKTSEQLGDTLKQEKVEKKLKALNRQRAQQLLKLAKQPETALGNLLSKDITRRENFEKAKALSKEIQDLSKGAMLLDLSVVSKNDIDHVLWRTAFYNVIETFRNAGKLFLGYSHEEHVMSSEDINKELWEFLSDASVFYTGLMDALQNMYNFEIHSIINQPRCTELLDRNAKLAMLSCHHILIFLGDIERYKEQMQPSKTINWGTVRAWYLKASKLAPKNGKPYNQLAVIAVYANRKLDAVYYYVRSLAVSSPILTAREKLTTIFYEIQRKAKQVSDDEREERLQREREQRQLEEAHAGRGRGRGRGQGGGRRVDAEEHSNARHEIWVFTIHGICRRYMVTDGGHIVSVNKSGVPISDESANVSHSTDTPVPEQPKVSLQEVNKKFMLHFLCAHGFLYTRISMDQLPPLQCQMMGEFQTLLGYPLCSSVSSISLLQMSAVNMFAIDHTAPSDTSEKFIRLGTPQDQALNLAVDMLTALLSACTSHLAASSADEGDKHFHGDDSGYQDNSGCGATLRQYLPAVKAWCDWLVCHCELWQASSVSTHRYLWETTAAFINEMSQMELSPTPEDDQGEQMITLFENDFLAGFKPLIAANKISMTVASTEQKELAEDHLRLSAIRDFASFLTSLENSPLRYNDESGVYSASITSLPSSPRGMDAGVGVHVDLHYHSPQKDSEDADVTVESVEDDVDSGDEDRKGFQELKAKKDALAREVEAHHKRHHQAQAVVQETVSRPHLMLENHVTYLVPDTNCFVDHLPGLQAIVDSGDFSLVVPLVVINELDGLGRELMVDKYRDMRHAQRVFQNARCAVDFLEDEFSKRNPQVHALTSKGSVLDTIMYRSEDPSARKGNNDDVILSCCLHYCEENFVNRLATADQPITIRRKVVLLTDDRNLRLKAHTRNVPVLPVPLFRAMAKV